jgi:hypothetical protein
MPATLSALIQVAAAMKGVPSDSPVKGRLDGVLQLMEQGIEAGRKAIHGLHIFDACPLDLAQVFSGIQRELAVPSDVEFRVIDEGLAPDSINLVVDGLMQRPLVTANKAF